MVLVPVRAVKLYRFFEEPVHSFFKQKFKSWTRRFYDHKIMYFTRIYAQIREVFRGKFIGLVLHLFLNFEAVAYYRAVKFFRLPVIGMIVVNNAKKAGVIEFLPF